MPKSAPAALSSPYKSILDWSVKWPEWQRDALRRIVVAGSLTPTDLKELEVICRAKHGLLPATGAAPTADPLTDAHTPGGADGAASVSLSKISGLQNVGRLPSDQEITFGAAPGLTVIYGENGAGKSGYARVIKRACRARGTPQEIRPDAFAAHSAGPATAQFVFRVGAVDTPIVWTDGKPADPRLGNIFVFDAFSARVHVGQEGPACFKPRGLDVLPELAKACNVIKAQVQKDIDATVEEISRAAQGWKYSAVTAIGKLINSLSAATKPEQIDAAATFTSDDERRLTEITATLNTDPRIRAADTDATAKRIRTLAETIKSRATSVDDTAMQAISDAIQEAESSARAAKAASGPELKDGDFPGSCNDVWRSLWDAAKEFSVAYAYPGREFPVTEPDAKCVLCQQVLQPDAIDRYARFNKFVADETRRRADAARTKVAELKTGVDLLRTIENEVTGIEADLNREAAGSIDAVEAFAKAIDARIAHAQKCLKDGAWAEAPAVPATPYVELITLADTLDKRAKDELAAAHPAKAKALATERDELTDKKWLANKKEEVKTQVARRIHKEKLEKCQEDCASRPVSDKAKELDTLHVTEAYRKAFEHERDALGLKTLPVSLTAVRVMKGESQFAVVVEGATKTNVEDIASEGEHRCIALAAFLAELSQASHKSALVFDDPVSSLDHKRREEIAKRLVREAEVRQVIVFTHDLAFVCDLERAISGGRSSIHCQHIEWRAGKPGSVASGLMWDAKSSDEQLKNLDERIGRADKVHREGSDSEYKMEAGPLVDHMRAACERLIEDVLLGDVLKRHSSQVKVGNVHRVANVQAKDWLAIKRVWDECSSATPAHANARSGPHKVPDPDQLKEWIQILKTTVESVKQARKSGSASAAVEPKSMPAPAPRA